VTDRPNVQYGDPAVALPNEILRSVVGSGLHGIAIAGTDDHDEMGVFIEPPEMVVGISPAMDHFTSRTQPEGARSGPGDTDLVIYSLRKYLHLAVKGNPTALLPLYAPVDQLLICGQLGQELRGLRDSFLSAGAVERFLGYMHSQHQRMLGRERKGRVPNRPELIEKHGWDVKYGSHALRLAYQGREVALDGRLSLPLREAEQERVLAVKRGEVPQLEVSAEISELEFEVRAALDGGYLAVPQHPDIQRLSAWSVAAHRRHWGWE
jgi:hypothetical protein